MLAWLLGAVGSGLAVWALFRAAPRGRSCAGCGYDMRGVPGLTCPECGRTAAGESGLHGPRRLWRVAAVGMTLTLLGAAFGMPVAWRYGLVRAAPTWALLLARCEAVDRCVDPNPDGSPIGEEVSARWEARTMRAGEMRWYWRDLGTHADYMCDWPHFWPAGVTIRVKLSPSSVFGECDAPMDDITVRVREAGIGEWQAWTCGPSCNPPWHPALTAARMGTANYTLECEAYVGETLLWSGTLTGSVTGVEASTMLAQVPSDDVSTWLREGLQPSLSGEWLTIVRPDPDCLAERSLTLGAELELLDGDDVVATGEWSQDLWSQTTRHDHLPDMVRLCWVRSVPPDGITPGLRLRLRGDCGVALTQDLDWYGQTWMEKPALSRFWTGSVEVPLVAAEPREDSGASAEP